VEKKQREKMMTDGNEATEKVTFHHPTDGRTIEVDLDPTMTSEEAINELIAGEFVPANPQGYMLTVKHTGNLMRADESFFDAGITSEKGDVRVDPATDAGTWS
jgi:hypothetical protein